MSKYFIWAKVFIAVVVIFMGYRFFNELDNNSVMLHSIQVSINDIKNSISDVKSTVASLARLESENEHAIANLHNEDIRWRERSF